MTPSERAMRARLAAHAMHAKNDTREVSQAGRDAFLARFEREVDPDGVLSPTERTRRAEHARSSYFTKLALKSAQARREKSAGNAEKPQERRFGPSVETGDSGRKPGPTTNPGGTSHKKVLVVKRRHQREMAR